MKILNYNSFLKTMQFESLTNIQKLAEESDKEKFKFDPNDVLGPEDTIDGSNPDDDEDEEYYDQLLGPEDTIDGSDPGEEE